MKNLLAVTLEEWKWTFIKSMIRATYFTNGEYFFENWIIMEFIFEETYLLIHFGKLLCTTYEIIIGNVSNSTINSSRGLVIHLRLEEKVLFS